MGEWSDAESPNCPNVFPDYWIVARHSSLPLALLKVLYQNRQDVASKHSTFKTERKQFQQPCLFELNGLYATPNRLAEVFFLTFIGYRLGKSEIAECLTETCLYMQAANRSMKIKMNLRALLFSSTTLSLPLLVSWAAGGQRQTLRF